MMTSRPVWLGVLLVAPLLLIGAAAGIAPTAEPEPTKGQALRVEYLEVVTDSVDATCDALAEAHGVVFGDPVAGLGNARTAELRGGGRIGVRAPMGPNETPVVRPYVLVDDIASAVKVAEAAGAEVAIPPTEIPGQGTFSIYLLGGIQHGLWQN